VFLITWQQKLRRPAGRNDHGTPIPVDLNVSGPRQHGVFSQKTGPCKPTVIQPEAGVELPPEWNGQNLLTASVFAWLKRQRLAEDKGPRQQLRRLKNSLEAGWIERGGERGIRHRGGSKMDPINTDRCVKKGPG
jgi:hypothetical protein